MARYRKRRSALLMQRIKWHRSLQEIILSAIFITPQQMAIIKIFLKSAQQRLVIN